MNVSESTVVLTGATDGIVHPGVITTRLLDSLFHMQGDPPAQAATNNV